MSWSSQPDRPGASAELCFLPQVRTLRSACRHPDALTGLSERGSPWEGQQEDLQQAWPCS